MKMPEFIKAVDTRILAIIGAVAFGLTFLIVGFIVITTMLDRKEAEAEFQEQLSIEDAIADQLNSPALKDFYFEQQFEDPELELILGRTPKDKWGEEEIERFWIPVEEMELEKLQERNRKIMEGKLDGIP